MAEMVKVSPKEAAELRNGLYDQIGAILEDSEPTVEGLTVCLDEERNIFATVKVTVHDNLKYDIDAKRQEYADKIANAAERAEERAAKAAEKAKKAAERAEKQTKKE